ncbi:MAG: adenylate/guanylate cyclase domain-containing protein [Candidatus Rokubacteria bacterium]|nr:adenylate/guanylate cyclase domain-containing protein [Candidatus Rokubacteria bacterium]
MPAQRPPETDYEALWRERLTRGHPKLRIAHRIFRLLPSPPRCKLCHNPFGGIGGKIVGLMGFARSRKNPNLCNRCCDILPPGGAEVDIAVLFADVRGSTAIGEKSRPSEYASLMTRFYRVATETLVRHDAIIDKFVGDEVMALFIPGFCGPGYRRRAADAAYALLRSVGYGPASEPWLHIHGAVYSGVAYVGNVGGEGIVDFTALGDPINTGSRLQGHAADGQFLLGDVVYASVSDRFPNLEIRSLALRGKDAPVTVRVLDAQGMQRDAQKDAPG